MGVVAAFGRYELLRRVGSGGMADIWKARVDGPGGFHKSLALKRILPELVENREFLRMFADEAKLVATLSHPNIVQVLDFGFVGKHDYFIAMEYIPGANLARLLNRSLETMSRLPPELAVYVAVEAARGLGYAHARTSPAGEPLGIIHRDVSPQNILLSFSGEVKLTDFGIARVSTVIPRTEAGHVRGKVAYMSPEQASADGSRPVGPRSDLFSLGIVLYEMITGQRLFPGGSSPENHARVITFRGPTAEELAPIPPVLRGIVSTALQGDPDRRFQTAQALETELAGALGVDVLLAGRQYLSALLPRLFPDEHRAEMEEDGVAVPRTNAQISLAQVDALPPRRPVGDDRPSVSDGGGVVPPALVGGDTIISPKVYGESELEPQDPQDPEHTRLPSENPEDPEHTRLPADAEASVPSALTLAPPIAVRERTRTYGDDEPLYPPRPPPPKWRSYALLAGGVVLGLPAAILVATLASRALTDDPPPPVASLTPMPMHGTPVPEETPALEETPVAPEETPIAVPATPTPVRTRPVTARTPPPATPEASSAFVPANGILRVDAQPACEVFVDHSSAGLTTPFERELKAGKHTLGFVHKGSGLWLEQTFDVPAGGTLSLFVDVNEATVRVR